MLWLESNSRYNLRKDEPSDWIIHWTVDVHAVVDIEFYPSGPSTYVIGRMMADEVRRFEIEEQGESIYEVGDSGSQDLLEALECFYPRGNNGVLDYRSVADPFVLLHRFELHPEFNEAKLAILDSFCRIYSNDAIIAFGSYANWTLPELHRVGFDEHEPYDDQIPIGKYLVRDNSMMTEYGPRNYPRDYPCGSEHHTRWLEQHGPWPE